MLLFSTNMIFADALSRKNAKGNKLYKEGKYGEAAQKYLDAQLESPKSNELNYNLGNANFKMKKYDKAVEYYQKALQTQDPKTEQSIRYNLGNALFKSGEQEVNEGKQEGLQKFTQAIESYKRALDLKTDDKDAKYNLEYVRRKLKEMSKRDEQKQQQQQKKQQDQQNQNQDKNKDQQKQKQDSTQQQQKPQQKKPGEMSEEEAKRLLDAYKDSEKDAKKKQEMRPAGRISVDKDW